jgi:hypothetical protein
MAHGQMALGEMFFWNLSSDVGVDRPNKPDDVELVRFGYCCYQLWPQEFMTFDEDLKSAVRELRWQGGYDKDLQAVIDMDQKKYAVQRDRCVSVAKSGIAKNLNYSKNQVWTIWALNTVMRFALPGLYPRIDMDSRSGPQITDTVRYSFISRSWSAEANPNW